MHTELIPLIYLLIAILSAGAGITLTSLFWMRWFQRWQEYHFHQEDVIARRRLPYQTSDGLMDAAAVVANAKRWINDLAVMVSHPQAMLLELQAGDYDAERPNIKGQLDD